MEVERIEVVKDWSKPKSVRNIQVFLGFANFYWRFIQGFSKIAALLTSMLKTIGSSDKPAPSKNNNSRSTSGRNDNSKPVSRRNDSNGEFDGFAGDGVEYTRKSRKLKKLFKSRKLAKSRKKLL